MARAPAGTVVEAVPPEATDETVADPMGVLEPSAAQSKVTDIAVPSPSVTVACKVGVSVASVGRLEPVTQAEAGTVARAVTAGSLL